MMDRESFQRLALKMACTQEGYLLREQQRLVPTPNLHNAINLVHDYLGPLRQPLRAISFALAFHPIVERWAAWGAWASVLDDVLAVSERYVTPQQRIQLLNNRSQAARELQDDATALTTAHDALRLAIQQQDSTLEATALNKLGLALHRQDNLRAAQHHWEQAYRVGMELLAPLELGHISMNLGLIAVQQQRFTDAHALFQQALRYYTEQDDQLHIARVHCNIADLLSRQNQLETVPLTLLAARDLFKQRNVRFSYGLAENDIGCIYLSLGNCELADQAFQAALAIFEEMGAITAQARVLSNVVALHLMYEDWHRAELCSRRALHLAELAAKPLLVATIKLDQGRIFAAWGNWRQARQLWKEALHVQLERDAHAAAQKTRELLGSIPDEREAG